MTSNGLPFSTLRSGNQRMTAVSRASSAANNNDSISISTGRRSLNINSSKNLRIESNTLTIGGGSNTGNRRLGEGRAKMSTNGLKVKGRNLQQNLGKFTELPQEYDGNNITRGYSQATDGSQSVTQKKRSYQLELGFHDSRYSEETVMLDLSQIPGAREGELAELKTYRGTAGPKSKKIYFITKGFDSESRRRSKNTQITVLSGQLQHVLDLPPRSKVWVKLKSKKEYQADLIELNIKDCLVNRGDMWSFSSQLADTCVFMEQKITFLSSLRATVKGIYRDGKKVLSGYIGEDTKIIFRSESARLIFLIQITDEMWHFEENGEKMFHKVVNSLFPKIFKKWKDIGTHHNITILFAASIDLSEVQFRDLQPGEKLKSTKDYYRIVVDQVSIVHWSEIMKTLRKEFAHIAKDLRNVKTEDGSSIIKGRFSPVIKSNILETINLASTLVINPFKQRDLRHTTTHVIVISPGTGLYDVDYDLLKCTSKKLLSLEITMDLICLTKAPLHIVPLFRYRDYENKLHHCTPTWLSISFWNDSTKKLNIWHPRCKIYDLQMMGLTENEIKEEIAIEYMSAPPKVKSIVELMNTYDSNTFTDTKNLRSRDERSSISSDFLEKNQDKRKNNGKETKITTFAWQTPKCANAMVQQAKTPQVFGDISAQPTSATECSDNDSAHHISLIQSPDQMKSLAVDTLKNATKTNSVVNFTQRIVSKIIPDIEVTKKRSFGFLRGNEGEEPRSEHKGQTNLPNKTYIPQIQAENTPILKKNLSSLEASENRKTCPFEIGSLQDSTSLRSPRNSHSMDRRPLLSGDRSKRTIRQTELKNSSISNDTWIEVSNPSAPVSAEMAGSLIPGRWKDVFPKYVAKKYSKWRSLTAPAELPVTTSLFPTSSDFDTNFVFRNHSVSLNLDQEIYNQTSYDLLRNMIYLRLLTGFQICIGDNVKKVEKARGKETEDPLIVKYLTEDNYTNAKIFMMIDNEIHRISCGYDGVIDVQRYIRKNEVNVFDPISSYIPWIKTRYETSYRQTDIDPLRATRESFNWNQLDQVLAGYGDSVIESNKKRYKSKFVVLPTEVPPTTFSSTVNGRKETLSAEEIRLEGLRRLISSISRSRMRTEGDTDNRKSRKEEILPEVLFYTGSLFNFIDEQKEILKTSGNTLKDSIFIEDGDRLTKDIELAKLAHEMQHGNKPLTLVNRKWHWKRHQNCFIGLELVNWLIEHFSDIDTREEAVLYGQDLMNRKLFVHVENRHGFLDGHYFYQITPEYVCEAHRLEKTVSVDRKFSAEANMPQRKGSTSNKSESNKTTISMTMISATNSRQSEDVQTKHEDNSQEPNNSTVLLSTAVSVDLDPTGKSHKKEICTVHYDRVHNPDHCFHIRLEWLTATPKLLDDLINNWYRLCDRYGLKLVEIPWDELCAIPSINPFHSFVDIKLAINPWHDPEFNDAEIFFHNRFYYHIYLLEKSGFLLDNRASKFLQHQEIDYEIVYSWGKPKFKFAQYVHSTGAYIAEIRENGDLFLAPNNIHISRVNIGNVVGKAQNSPKFALDSQKVMLNFKKTCLDYAKLRNIFLEAKERRLENKDNEEYGLFATF